MHLVLIYDLTDDYLERRGEFRDEHLRLARAAHERGELAMVGPFTDPADSSMFVWRTTDRTVVEQFVALDPYVAGGLVKSWRIREWNVVIGG
jgi:uncharacterized protein YciI